MASRLMHRGPDGAGEWSGPGAALAHLHLHTGSSSPRQPLRLADGRVCVIDGRVDDAQALLRALDMPDDTADPGHAGCIALAMQRWGDDFWRHVEGDFAVACWDPAARRLQLFRDRLGVRPLFHVRTAGWVAFASEPEALFALPGVNARIRDATIAEVWTQLPFPRMPWSDTEGVVATVPPAHRVDVASSGTMVAGRYWRLEPQEPLRLADEREYVDAFREVFGRATLALTRDVDRTALMLSGGVDSGAILAATRGFRDVATPGNLVCISAVSHPSLDDPAARTETANILALTGGDRNARSFTVPSAAGTGDLVEAADAAEVAWSWRHPVDASLYIPSLASRIARQQGLRVILSGVAGDLVTAAPLGYMGRLALQGRWRDAWRESAAASRTHTYLAGSRGPLPLLARAVVAEMQPRALRRFRLRRQGAIERVRLHASGLSADFIGASGIEAIHAMGLEERVRRAGLPPEEQRCLALADRLDDAFQGFNRVVARQGVEARDPWSHPAVLAFFLALPVEWRARAGWTKYVVRRACEDALGREVVWHSGKRHHGALVTRQVVADAAPYLSRYLDAMAPRLTEYLEPGVLANARDALAAGDAMTYRQADDVNALVALAGWLERQGGRGTPAHPPDGLDLA